jgi:striatin 1/3/4
MDEGPVARPFMMSPGSSLAPTGGEVPQQQAGYSVPGVLQFIKQEFSRFEKERGSWEVEKAELESKIAFLQGERKGHENLMRDLVRRIKMLEYALKQERNKVYKLTHDGCGLAIKPPELDPVDSNTTTNILEAPSYPSLTNQKESRRILRDYLREVGFPDNVLEARVARLNLYRTLMNGSSNQPPSDISIQPSSIEQQQYSIKPHPPPPDINSE